MDKIYVLTAGEYRDWHVMGFVETEEEAKKICDYKNAVSTYVDWHYTETDKYSDECPSVKTIYRITIMLRELASGWEATITYPSCVCFFTDDPEMKEPKFCDITNSFFGEEEIRTAICEIDLDEEDYGKATEIAFERLHKKLENLSV